MAKSPTFSKGEWIVHHYYGVGQVKGIEKKVLDGSKVAYYRVKTRNSQYWVPVESEDNSRLRPLWIPRRPCRHDVELDSPVRRLANHS